MSAPLINIFSGVNADLLMTSDIGSGLARFAYEKARGRSTSHAVAEQVTQTIGSTIGRLVDITDDKTTISALQGNNPLMKSVAAGLASGGIDYAMGRGGKVERFVAPALIDGAAVFIGSQITAGDARIL